MGNENKGGRAKKKRFRGNQHTKQTDIDLKLPGCPIVDNVNNVYPEAQPDPPTLCSSAKKIKLDNGLKPDVNDSLDCFIIMNLSLLSNFISSNFRCGECNQFSLYTSFEDNQRDGFCHTIKMSCSSADCLWSGSFNTSNQIRQGSKRGHQKVKLRMVTFARSLGRGYSVLTNFSQHLNSPKPITATAYQTIVKKVCSASAQVASESMKRAAEEVRDKLGTEDGNIGNCGVSVDGTWQRRGHSSHHGVVTVKSLETDKCLDVEVFSNICKACQRWEGKKGTKDYEIW
ncbi:hypothetical protein ElyMa_005281200 [Elysia marginata]|uniref:Mutator-like transposase domain-containing protein n=1 Tax=Elysia marginata TaxID=1093978 RepID=A0AAV4JXU9_9GAST|nr:hypothetical protein ElyMa_005281200 [Elysia marginata]